MSQRLGENDLNTLMSLVFDGEQLSSDNPLPVSLSEETIQALKDVQPDYYVGVLPQVTRTSGDTASPINADHILVGGVDDNNNEYQVLSFKGNAARVYDADTLTLLNAIYTRQADFNQRTALVDTVGGVIGSLPTGNGTERGLMTIQGGTNYIQSTLNSSTTNVAASSTWTGSIENRGNQQTLIALCKPTGTNGIVTINQYANASAVGPVVTKTYNLGTSDSLAIAIQLTGVTFRVSYQNLNGTPTSIFDFKCFLTTMLSQTTLGNMPAAINEVNGLPFSLGQQAVASSLPVVDAVPVSLAFVPATAAINYNYLTGATSISGIGTGWFDATQYNSMSFSITSNNGVGVIQFEQTNDASNTVGSPWYVTNTSVTPQTAVTSFTLLAGTLRTFTGDIKAKYIRVRVSTATTAQSNANTTLRQAYAAIRTVTSIEGTPAVTITSGTVTTVSSANLGIPFATSDLTGALTTTTTSSAITPTFGCSFQVNINVTAVSGTNPTMDVSIEVSKDNGTTYEKVYDFPRITTTGVYYCPLLFLEGTRIRYVQTVGGTTPSFTRSIFRQQSSVTPDQFITQLVNRTIDLNTLNSVTPWINTRNARSVQLVVNIASAVVAPVIQLEATDDNGVTSDLIGTTVTPPIAGGTTRMTVSGDFNAQQVRAKVTTAGTTAVIGYVLVKGY